MCIGADGGDGESADAAAEQANDDDDEIIILNESRMMLHVDKGR